MVTFFSQFLRTSLTILAALTFIACAKEKDNDSPSPAPMAVPTRYLYVSSGACQAGANTTFTTTSSSNIVYRVNLSTGNRDMTLADYNLNGASGESPVAVVDYDANSILVAVEKTGARRIEKVEKKMNGTRSTFSADPLALAAAITDMAKRLDGSIYVARTSGVALLSNSGTTQNAAFAAANPGGNCGATNIKYNAVRSSEMGHLIFLNSENNDNKIGVMRSGPTCLSGITPTPGTAQATALASIKGSNQVIAAYSGNTAAADANTLYAYDLAEDATTATLSGATKIYDVSLYPATYPYQLYAVSAMTYDPVDKHLYVATANQIAANIATTGNYQIEKFSYDAATKTLTRVGSTPFYPSAIDTKCISSMFIGN